METMARMKAARLRGLRAELARLRLAIGAHHEELAALLADRAGMDAECQRELRALRAEGERLAEEFHRLRAEMDEARGRPTGSP